MPPVHPALRMLALLGVCLCPALAGEVESVPFVPPFVFLNHGADSHAFL